MIKRMGILAALFVLFSAYLVAGNENAGRIELSNDFWVVLGCIVGCACLGILWYAITGDTDNWDD